MVADKRTAAPLIQDPHDPSFTRAFVRSSEVEMDTVMRRVLPRALIALILTSPIAATCVANATGSETHSPLFKPWISGVSMDESQMQVQRYDDNT